MLKKKTKNKRTEGKEEVKKNDTSKEEDKKKKTQVERKEYVHTNSCRNGIIWDLFLCRWTKMPSNRGRQNSSLSHNHALLISHPQMQDSWQKVKANSINCSLMLHLNAKVYFTDSHKSGKTKIKQRALLTNQEVIESGTENNMPGGVCNTFEYYLSCWIRYK